MGSDKSWDDSIVELEKATGWVRVDSARLSWADEVEDAMQDSSGADDNSDNSDTESFYTARSRSASIAHEDIANAYSRPADLPKDQEILQENGDDGDDDDDDDDEEEEEEEEEEENKDAAYDPEDSGTPCTWEMYGDRILYLQARDAFSDGPNKAYLRHRFAPPEPNGQTPPADIWHCRWADRCECHDAARLGDSERARVEKCRADYAVDDDWKGWLPEYIKLRPYAQRGMRSVDDAVGGLTGRDKNKRTKEAGVPALVVTSPEGDTMYPHDTKAWPGAPPHQEDGFIGGPLRPTRFYEVAYEDEDSPDC